MAVCPRCGNQARSTARTQSDIEEKGDPKSSLFVVNGSHKDWGKVHQTCPACGNMEMRN